MTKRVVLLAVLVGCLSEIAYSQATSFEQLQVLVNQGDTVTITENNGTVSRGRVTELSQSALRLSLDGIIREFSQSNVRQIQQRRQDSLANGALIGAVGGLGFSAVLAGLVCSFEGGCGAEVALPIALFTGAGAGLGVTIDALIVRQKTIYSGPNQSLAGRFDVKPLISGDRKGVSLSFRF